MINYFYKIENDIYKTILESIKKYNIKNYLVSLSGGLDSSVLLYLINKLKFNYINLRAVHVNHKLNNNSNIYENYCIKQCKILNINLIINNLNINYNLIKKFGLENICRKLRYESIKKIIKNNEILLTAHHKNDQIETFFIFLNRGAGIEGLSCIKKFNNIYGIKILRPLLNYKKEYIKNYAIFNNIKYIEDISNINNSIQRNFIRNKIIPIIENKLPNFVESVFRSINILSEEEKIIKIFIKKKINYVLSKNNLLNIKKLKSINNDSIIKLIIKYWFKKKNLLISFNDINSINKQIIKSNKLDSKPIIKIKNNKYITKFNNLIYCINKPIEIKKCLLELKNKIVLPKNIGFLKKSPNLNINNNKYIYTKLKKNNINEKIYIKFLHLSYHTKIKTLDFNNKKQIKKLWNLYKIPYWIRNQIPFLFFNNKFISALNVFVTNYGECLTNDEYIYIKWYNSPIKKFLRNINQ